MIGLAISPALAPGKAAPYVIAAYVVFVTVILIYVAIMARRLTKTEDDLARLKREFDNSGPRGGGLAPEQAGEREREGATRRREQEPVG